MSTARAGRKRERSGPVPLADAMQDLLRSLGLEQRLAAYDVLAAWPDAVGEKIARVTAARRVERGVLYVDVATAPWRAELTMKRLELIDRLNERAGGRLITDIRFR